VRRESVSSVGSVSWCTGQSSVVYVAVICSAERLGSTQDRSLHRVGVLSESKCDWRGGSMFASVPR
jgi:hypothetical protein